jgi:hypothetical protein
MRVPIDDLALCLAGEGVPAVRRHCEGARISASCRLKSSNFVACLEVHNPYLSPKQRRKNVSRTGEEGPARYIKR